MSIRHTVRLRYAPNTENNHFEPQSVFEVYPVIQEDLHHDNPREAVKMWALPYPHILVEHSQ